MDRPRRNVNPRPHYNDYYPVEHHQRLVENSRASHAQSRRGRGGATRGSPAATHPDAHAAVAPSGEPFLATTTVNQDPPTHSDPVESGPIPPQHPDFAHSNEHVDDDSRAPSSHRNPSPATQPARHHVPEHVPAAPSRVLAPPQDTTPHFNSPAAGSPHNPRSNLSPLDDAPRPATLEVLSQASPARSSGPRSDDPNQPSSRPDDAPPMQSPPSPFIVVVTLAGFLPFPHLQSGIYVAQSSESDDPTLLPPVSRLLRAASLLPGEASAARDLLTHVLDANFRTSAVWTGDTLVPSGYAWSASNPMPPGHFLRHGTVGELIDSPAHRNIRASPCTEPAAFISELRRYFAVPAQDQPINNVRVIHLYIEHFMLRNPALPPFEYPSLSPDPDRPAAQPANGDPAPPPSMFAPQSASYAGAQDDVLQLIRQRFPDVVDDIQYCQIATLPRNRRGQARVAYVQRHPEAALDPVREYGSAYASWRIYAHILHICRGWTLDIQEPSEPRLVDFEPGYHLVSPFDLCHAFGVPTGSWSNFKGRFKGLVAANTNLTTCSTMRPVDDMVAIVARLIAPKLSWFLKDIKAVNPRAEYPNHAAEDAIWRWGTSSFCREVHPWRAGIPEAVALPSSASPEQFLF
ncbi:hypothetical protein AURDEDRAFT_166388 [Auricularia subglabra TFB-10046 SS5]|uniref:Uncharacterized protein n=1 Tax=Auricularia subglabra (strain TFB-10046 / SS5) TaxID=717982 RepID=J0LKR1_AURST|nr:hypothetical protein AURDEDRAFT_166388 [Auricularia subglabra TFB-10046 SS5]